MQRHIFFAPPPWALGRGQKVKYHYTSITKSISKIFLPNFVCILTHERYKACQAGFLICPPGSCPRGGTWGGGSIFFRKFNQIWCLSYLHEWHMYRRHFLCPQPVWPWGGAKRSNIIKSEFQRILNQCLCIFSQMKDI